MVKEDLAAHDFVINGTYTLDKGYGYVLTLDDANKSVIHADFDKTEGRHEFYYNVTNKEGKSAQVKFQAKDRMFKNELAKDYQKWDVRDSKYIFYAKATGNNSSLATAYMYLHKDGSVVLDDPSGANRVVTLGKTWTEDNGIITLKDGEQTFTSMNSVNPAHPGKRIDYNNKVYLLSENPEVKWKKLTLNDFEGEPEHCFIGSYETTGVQSAKYDVTLNLVSGGVAKRFVNSWTVESQGTWTLENGVYTVVLGETTYVSETNDGVTTITYQVEYKMPWGGDPLYAECVLTLQSK